MLIASMLASGLAMFVFAQTQRSLRRRYRRAELSIWRLAFLRGGACALLALAWCSAAKSLGAQLGSLFWIAELGVIGLLLTVLLALREPDVAALRRTPSGIDIGATKL